jgi:hypothetical protein
MKDLPTWVRLWVLGIIWGARCGVASAVALVIAWVAAHGTGGDNADQLLVGVPLEGVLACCFGAIVGAHIGLLIGLFAGLVLTAMLRMAPRAAALTTVVLTLLAQLSATLVIFGAPAGSQLWAYAVVPVIAVGPLALVTHRVARDVSRRKVSHRDTLAA